MFSSEFPDTRIEGAFGTIYTRGIRGSLRSQGGFRGSGESLTLITYYLSLITQDSALMTRVIISIIHSC